MSLEDIAEQWETVKFIAQLSQEYLKATGVSSYVPGVIINGYPSLIVEDFDFSQESLEQAIWRQTQHDFLLIQTQIQQGKYPREPLRAQEAIYFFVQTTGYYADWLVKAPLKYLPLSAVLFPNASETIQALANTQQAGFGLFLDQQLDYTGDSTQSASHVHLLALDLATQQGLRTLASLALRFPGIQASGVRFGVIHNCRCAAGLPFNTTLTGDGCSQILNDVVNIAGRALSFPKYLSFLQHVVPKFFRGATDNQVDVIKVMKDDIRVGALTVDRFVNLYKNHPWRETVANIHHFLASEVLHLEPGVNYIISNGRVYEIPIEVESVPASAFKLIEDLQASRQQYFRDFGLEFLDYELRAFLQEKLESLYMFLVSNSVGARYRIPLDSQVFSSNSSLRFQGVLNPLSKFAQEAFPVLYEFKTLLGDLLDVEIILRLGELTADLSLKNDFSSTLQSSLLFVETLNKNPSHSHEIPQISQSDILQ